MIELRRRYNMADDALSGLPPEYQRVEYLESTGTQYIKTDILAKDGINIEIDFQFTRFQMASILFGANHGNRWYFYYRQEYQWNFGHGEDKLVEIDTPYQRHVVNYITTQDKGVNIDGVRVINFNEYIDVN